MATSFKPIGAQLDFGNPTTSDLITPMSPTGVVQRRVASGQITITDLNDGKMIQAYTVASLGDTQVYKPDIRQYTPDYTAIDAQNNAVPQIITASVFMSGQNTDLAPTAACTGWAWTVDGSPELPSWAKADGHRLVINKNIVAGVGLMNIGWGCVCTDPESKMSVQVTGNKTLSLVESAGATGLVIIEQPFGTTFDGTGQRTSLTGKARLMRGGTHDKTVSKAVWEALDISGGTWKKVTKGVKELADGVSEISVTADDVLNFQTYRCVMTDTETGEEFTGIATFLDAADPYMVELYTLTGDVIRNGEGSTTIYARLWRRGEIVEDGESSLYNYGFTKFNALGVAEAWSDTTGCVAGNKVKFGNPVTVQAADVKNKATFYCNVTKKI